jgi:tetratricopeptide (TPR) repeat protein
VRPRRWRDILPLALVALLAWRSVRFVAEWALLAAPFIAGGLARLAPARWSRAPVTAALAVALAAIVVAERAAGRPESLTLPGLASDVVPFDAIDFVTTTGLRRRMFHDLDVGCYLLWQGWPRWQVFEDARLPAYPDEFHRAMDGTPNDAHAFDALLRRWDVDAALIVEPGTNRRAGSFDPDEWALVWRARNALVFARRTPAHATLIAAREIPLRITFRWEDGMHTAPLAAPPAGSPVSRCEWDRRLGAVLDSDGDFDRALDARADALAAGCLSPSDEADARFYLGARLQRAGQLAAAAAEYDRVLALRPDDARARTNRAWALLPSEISRALRDTLTRANPRCLDWAVR